MEKIVEQTLLYDFYGDLLTEHQRRIYEDVVFNDNLKRCSRILQSYEDKLHLVEKFVTIREKIRQIHQLSRDCDSLSKQDLVSRIEEISQEILKEL